VSAGAARRPDWTWLRDPGHFLALGGGSGLAPKAPGTFGSIVGVGVYLLLAPLGWQACALALVVMFAAGVPLCARTARALGVHDHPAIVWDEVVGVFLTLVCGSGSLPALALGFVLFRIFDIWKPWPVRWADGKVAGGLGVMLDDVLAALYAGAGLALFEYISYS
jgi:phosphatidylglycerophosphatase A